VQPCFYCAWPIRTTKGRKCTRCRTPRRNGSYCPSETIARLSGFPSLGREIWSSLCSSSVFLCARSQAKQTKHTSLYGLEAIGLVHRACLDRAPASPTNARARQFFGAHFSRPHFALELAEKVNWWPKSWQGSENLASIQTGAHVHSQRQNFGWAVAGYHPNTPINSSWAL
jgi:hypothetical protein